MSVADGTRRLAVADGLGDPIQSSSGRALGRLPGDAKPGAGHGARSQHSGSSEIRRTLAAFFKALQEQDVERWSNMVTDDFIAFDVGNVFRGRKLFSAAGAALAAGRIHSWRVTRLKVHSCEKWAHATYLNRGAPNAAWLESALLQRDQNGWRLKFLHSTRIDCAAA